MTLSEMTAALNTVYENRFGTDYSGYFNISAAEAERIAEKSSSAAEFENTWQNTDWWTDENNA